MSRSKVGKIEADGGSLRAAIADAVDLVIAVLVGVALAGGPWMM